MSTASASIGIVGASIKALDRLKVLGIGRGKVKLLQKPVFESHREACLKVVDFNHVIPLIAFCFKK